MNDWYTDAVKQALEIVPVEWEEAAIESTALKYRLVKRRLFAVESQYKWSQTFGQWRTITFYEAQALIDKAFREWLDEKTADALAWGFYEGLWAAWSSRFGESTFLAQDEPTYTELLAKAVLELDKRERNYGSVDK